MKKLYILSLVMLIFIAGNTYAPEPTKFKVAIDISIHNTDNEVHKNLATNYIKRELRSLADVQVVSSNIIENPIWDYCITLVMVVVKDTFYSASITVMEKIPVNHFTPRWQQHYKEIPAVFFPTNTTAMVGIQRLEDFIKSEIANFDIDYLQFARKNR